MNWWCSRTDNFLYDVTLICKNTKTISKSNCRLYVFFSYIFVIFFMSTYIYFFISYFLRNFHILAPLLSRTVIQSSLFVHMLHILCYIIVIYIYNIVYMCCISLFNFHNLHTSCFMCYILVLHFWILPPVFNIQIFLHMLHILVTFFFIFTDKPPCIYETCILVTFFCNLHQNLLHICYLSLLHYCNLHLLYNCYISLLHFCNSPHVRMLHILCYMFVITYKGSSVF